MKNYKLSTVLVTLYLIVYTLLHQLNAPFALLATMFVISPFLVLWMAYTIIRYAPYNGKELEEDEEWAYQDIEKKDLKN